jgi:dipeptidase
MKCPCVAVLVCVVVFSIGGAVPAGACTNLLVTKGASADGSVFITYTCDGEFHPRLQYLPAADHKADEWFQLSDWTGWRNGSLSAGARIGGISGWGLRISGSCWPIRSGT